jgi:23S rRNA C2498 (ribose-2'-O)-methylase RlmM
VARLKFCGLQFELNLSQEKMRNLAAIVHIAEEMNKRKRFGYYRFVYCCDTHTGGKWIPLLSYSRVGPCSCGQVLSISKAKELLNKEQRIERVVQELEAEFPEETI